MWRSRAALAKGRAMPACGVLRRMAGNAAVAVLLYAFRDGDANMRSVWLCSRNDAIGNVAVVMAAAGVFGSGTIWPDVGVAVLLRGLSLSAARSGITHARVELRQETERAATPAAVPAVAVITFKPAAPRSRTSPV